MTHFTYQTQVELYDTDAGGVIFFSHLFHFTHRAFSAFLKELQITIQERLIQQDFFFPVVHAQGDYLAPIFCDDTLLIEVYVLSIGTSSFRMGYKLYKQNDCVAKAEVVHAAIDHTKSKTDLPQDFKEKLKVYLI